ncbi:MAG: hypothetical protein GX443_06985 [Deltaproteobacteria bacterium]|nr:hypothetical protein [Deltaproteobacteria bacterium]
MKRFLFAVSLAALLPFIAECSLAAENANSSGVALQVAQARQGANACMDRCEKAKDNCMAYYVKSDSTSGRYVSADGAKTCWEAYHQCKRQCPR